MNSRQKEYLNYTLEQEKEIISELKEVYNKALNDINQKIAILLGREDTENLQSIIYQVDYQKAIKKQINAILDVLHSEEYEKIQEYLMKSYENGYLGTMYDLQGQGIPLIIPIDQEKVLEALTVDSKLSKSLYESLGEDIKVLKNKVRTNISRGIASGLSYQDIATNISNTSKIGINNAIRIARTEAGRIQNQASFDAQTKAKEKGADVVKQWDATLDSRTRTSHRILDGQIRELDEPFEYKGYKAMHPHGFGVPRLDINCRCALLQRAKWGLDEEELEELKKKASYFKLDKTKSFEDFKIKYLENISK